MPTTYVLKLINHFDSGEYFFFTQPPEAAGVTGVFINTWVEAAVPKGGYEKISATLKFNAWCGASPTSNPDSGTIIQGGMSDPVSLGVTGGAPGTTWKTKTLDSSTLEFVPASAAAEAGCFEIDTGSDFTMADNFMIGMALPDPNDPGSIVPVATFLAKPSMNTNIGPIVKFFVAEGQSVQGTIIDFQSVSSTAGLWDFSPGAPGEGMTYGEITLDNHGVFSDATYKPHPPSDNIEVDPELVIAVFKPIIQAAAAGALINYLLNKLKDMNVTSITWSGLGAKLNLKFAPGTDLRGSPMKEIEDSLKSAVKDKVIPSNEKWNLIT